MIESPLSSDMPRIEGDATKSVDPGNLPGKPRKTPARKTEATLVSFFGEKPVGAAAFVASVRSEGKKRFDETDIAAAAVAMVANDPVGTRLLALAAQPNPPPAIAVWLRPKVLARLKDRLPGRFNLESADAAVIFRGVHEDLAPRLTSVSPETRLEARTLLLLALTWLSPRSSFKPTDALEDLYGTFFKESDAARDAVLRALSGGEVKGLRQAAAVAGLGRDAVRAANERAERENSRRNDAEDTLAAVRRQVAELTAQVTSLETERADLSARLTAEEKRFEERQQHWGNDLASTTARQKLMLARLAPLLETAVEALAGEPAYADIALERLHEALSTIRESAK